MHFRFLQFPKTSLEHTLSDSGLHPRVPDLALLIQRIPFPEAGNENAYYMHVLWQQNFSERSEGS